MTIRYASLYEAKKAVILWNGKPESVEHLGNYSNSVFKFKNNHDETLVLRFTDSRQRSYEEILAELEYLVYLKTCKSPSCSALAAMNGLLAVPFESSEGLLICSVLNFVEGIRIDESSADWNKEFFLNWGRNLALLHKSSRNFHPEKNRRWVWDHEHLILNAQKLIPSSDTKSFEIFKKIILDCNSLDVTESNFGLIHADHAPQNFQFDLISKKITAIDFGNCCYHWYLADVAISLSTIRNKINREEIKSCLLEGYSESEVLPKKYEYILDLFIRFRIVYVYLDRLYRFGQSPSAEQVVALKSLQEKVHSEDGW